MAKDVAPRSTPLATPVPLGRHRTASDDALAAILHPAYREGIGRVGAGRVAFRGVPFSLAPTNAANRWLVVDRPIEIDLRGQGLCGRVIVAHFADTSRAWPGGRPADLPVGWVEPVGELLARYVLETSTGARVERTVRRRFEVNDGIIGWGQGAFAAFQHRLDEPLEWRGPHPALAPARYAAAGEAGLLGVMPGSWGPDQTGILDSVPSPTDEIMLWLHEIEVPGGPSRLARLQLEPATPGEGGTVVVAGITLHAGVASPLRLEPRRTFRIQRREKRDGDLAVDLGIVIRERPDGSAGSADWPADSVPGWGSPHPSVEDAGDHDARATIAELALAPDARITVGDATFAARRLPADGRPRRSGGVTITPLPVADRRIDIEVVDATTGRPMPARVHLRADDGRYLPPLGHREEINPGLNEDTGSDVLMGGTPSAYVPGRFPILVPEGSIHVEAAAGFRYRPARRSIDLAAEGPGPIRIALDPIDGVADDGWVAADCHVHFISPTSALLQAQAEGVELVNLLATQWGDHHTSQADLPVAAVQDASGGHLVVMGSENRQNMLGHIGLLGASEAVYPMSSGGGPEGRLGDPLEWLMADWADAARAQHGLSLAVHFPLPYAEVAADIVHGRIDAVEMQALTRGVDGPPIREWYRFLSCGYRLPIVGGTDKMSAEIPLGAIRTYARLGPDVPLTFGAWAAAVRAGRTFVTSGPLVELSVDGREPGDVIKFGRRGGTVEVRAKAVAALPVIDGIELVHDGRVVARRAADGTARIDLSETVKVSGSGWLAVRVTSPEVIHSAFTTAMGAHTSPVYLEVAGRRAYDPASAAAIRTIVEGSRAWVGSQATIAVRADRARLDTFFADALDLLDGIGGPG